MDMNRFTKEPNLSIVKNEFVEIDMREEPNLSIVKNEFVEMDMREEPNLSIVKNEFVETSNVYLDKDDCQMNYLVKNENKTEYSIPKNQIMCQYICLYCQNIYNVPMEHSMIYKAKINDSECILPCSFVCGQLNNTVDGAQFTRQINKIAVSSPEINFGYHFLNAEHKLDLSYILADDVAQEIYYRGMCNASKMYQKNGFKSKKKLPKLWPIQNHVKQTSNSNNIANKLKLNRTQLSTKISSQINTFEINAQKTSSNTHINSFQPQFSIVDESYLPVPALQLMIDHEFSNTNCKSNMCFSNNKDNYKLLNNRKPIKRKKVQPSTSNVISLGKTCKVLHTNSHQSDLIKTDNVKLSDLPPIIPLSVLHYMDELEFSHKGDNQC